MHGLHDPRGFGLSFTLVVLAWIFSFFLGFAKGFSRLWFAFLSPVGIVGRVGLAT